MCGKQGGRGNVLLAWARFVSPWCQTCPSAIHIAYTLYIHYTSCTYIALKIANTVLHLSVFTLFTLQVNILYTLLYVHRFPLYTSAVNYVTHRVPQCNDHLHRFRCLPRTYIHMCDFPMIIISLKFQVRCETGFICFPWFRVFEGCQVYQANASHGRYKSQHLSLKSAFCHWNDPPNGKGTNFAGLTVKGEEIFYDVQDLFPEGKTWRMFARYILPAENSAINFTCYFFTFLLAVVIKWIMKKI